MNYKKISITSLITVLAISCFSSFAQAATFTDVKPTDWFYTPVEQLVSQGVFTINTTTFRPNDPANRAEAAMTLYKSMGFNIDPSTPTTPTFKDVPKDFWGYTAIETLAKNGVITGMKDQNGKPTGYFKPQEFVTREQFTKMVTLGTPFTTNTFGGPHFPDVAASRWSYQFIETAYNWGAIKGNPDGKFYPERNVNRAEMAQITEKAVAGDMRGDPVLNFIDDASAISTNMVEVCFTIKPTNDFLVASNYSIKNSSGQTLKVLSVKQASDPSCVELTTDQQISGEKYTFEFTVKNADGQESFWDNAEFQAMIQDPYLNYIADATALSMNSVEVCFEGEVDETMMSKDFFTVVDSSEKPLEIMSVAKTQDPLCLQITTATQTNGEKYTLTFTMKDSKGSIIYNDSTEFQPLFAAEAGLACTGPNTPINISAAKGQKSMLLLQVVCFGGADPIAISSFTFHYTNSGSISDFINFSLEHDGQKIVSTPVIDAKNKTVTYQNLKLMVQSDGAYTEFDLKADINAAATAGIMHQWQLTTEKDIDANISWVDGSFPLLGNSITVKP